MYNSFILAENKKEENFEFSHHRASISGMVTSSDSWQLEGAYHYISIDILVSEVRSVGGKCILKKDGRPEKIGK